MTGPGFRPCVRSRSNRPVQLLYSSSECSQRPTRPERYIAGESEMKCYNHPGVGAVGRCAICARPLCRDCIVVVDGKRYCKEDAATLLARQQRADSTRRSVVALTTASVLAALDGLSGIVVGFLLIILGLLGPASSNPYILSNTVEPLLQYFANVIVFPASHWRSVSLS